MTASFAQSKRALRLKTMFEKADINKKQKDNSQQIEKQSITKNGIVKYMDNYKP